MESSPWQNKIKIKDRNKNNTQSESYLYQFHSSIALHSRQQCQKIVLMTHKYRGCIIVLLINKSVELNKEQKVLTSGFDQGFTVILANGFSGVFDNASK
jgi:formyltetrahydrofolate hydrolase